MTLQQDCAVFIAGGGPCGLMLANELGRRGISVVLVDDKPGTAFNPQANATQARTMEHYRRLGFAQEIRALGLPAEFPTDIAYFTRYATHELGRFKLPSAREATEKVRGLSGSWSAAELPHRVSQKFVEQVLRRHAEALPGVSVNYGWRMLAFEDRGDHVEVSAERIADGARATVRAAYLVGADGPRSLVRQTLGIRYSGDGGAVRDFFGGRMYAIYLRAKQFYEVVPHAPAWMNVTFNHDRRAFMAAVDGRGEFAFHTQLRDHEHEDDITDEDAKAMFRAAVGAPLDVEIISRGTWTAGYALVAESFGRGRVFIGGDAAHLFTPAGGLGYNTAIDDAVNLGWKLAATLKGQGGPLLLASYEAERRPIAERNTGFARGFADSLGLFAPVPHIEEDTPEGAAARAAAGDYLATHGKKEFDIPGITFGARYDRSPIVIPDGSLPPPDAPDRYEPTACPGGRAPHVWLASGQSLYDRFGFEWTLLQARPGAGDTILEAARSRNLGLTAVTMESDEVRDAYGADLVLIRPDQVVAWRGNAPADAEALLSRALGREAATVS
jgi:2-polyprenyl-6-methoxyphenol hydroxylase-like FAD-dependent oxidoreductase